MNKLTKSLALAGLFWFGAATANAATAHVTFDVHDNPEYRTVVLVSETTGDYSAGYGQISEPGADNVDIGNVERGKPYFFVAYRLATDGEHSANSEEYPFTAPAGADPVLIELPPLEVSGQVLNISITVN